MIKDGTEAIVQGSKGLQAGGHGGQDGTDSVDGSSTGLLKELIKLKDKHALEKQRRAQLKAAKDAEEERRARLEIQRREVDKASAFATSAANALGVVAALIASALLSVLLSPPDTIHDSQSWGGSDTKTDVACYIPESSGPDSTTMPADISQCLRWVTLYGIAANLALGFEMMVLTLAVLISVGMVRFLKLAIICWFYGKTFSMIAVLSALWLSFGYVVAVFATVNLSFTIALGTLFMVSPAVWVYYNISGRYKQLSVLGEPAENTTIIHWLACGSNFKPFEICMGTYLRLLAVTDCKCSSLWEEGVPPLFLAAERGRAALAHIMLEAGALPDQAFRGYTPLYVAAEGDHVLTVKALLKYGADPDGVCGGGQTALAVATKQGHQRVVDMLLQAGATQ